MTFPLAAHNIGTELHDIKWVLIWILVAIVVKDFK